MAKLLLDSDLYVSYNQFMVNDASVPLPGLAWTKPHSEQGFARQSSTVNFKALVPYGEASLKVYLDSCPESNQFSRVIVVPFYSPTGKVLISGPEEDNGFVLIGPGNYELYAAQRLARRTVDEDTEDQLEIELHFNESLTPLQNSKILVADSAIIPPQMLLEDAQIAEV